MSMKISQETFDEGVSDNADLLNLSEVDALKETIDQFNKQGVSLSNVDTSGGVGRQEMLDLLTALQYSSQCEPSVSLGVIKDITKLCNKDNELHRRNIMLMRKKGGLNSLHVMFEVKLGSGVLISVMTLLSELSKVDDDTRDFFEPGGCNRLCKVLSSALDGVLRTDSNRTALICAIFTLARTVNKSENNKNSLMKEGIGALLVRFLNETAAKNTGAEDESLLLQEACHLVRALCVHDDYRKDMSCAYDNGKFFIKQSGFVQTLSTLAAGFRSQPGVASAALHAARNLITSEESVQVIAQYGAIELVTDILGSEAASLSLTRSAVALMRNVCADDIRKDKLVADGTLDLLLHSMSREVYAIDSSFAEHALACLAAMSLRSPSNAERIVHHGQALEIIVRTMRRHADRSALQRQGCLAVRNIAARCPDLRGQLLDAGLEPVLRAAGRLSGVVDEAYAALRDLECDVHFVKISEDGTVAPAYEQFGAPLSGAPAKKLQFNPVYDDDSSVIEQRVQEEARAPLQPENLRQDEAHDHVFSSVDAAVEATSSSAADSCCAGGHDHSHDHGHQH